MSELATRAAQPWALPQVTGPTIGRGRAEDLKAVERDAFETGLAAGREAGLIAIRVEQQHELDALRDRVERLDAILEVLSEPLKDMETSIQEQLVTLAGAIAQQVVRRELRYQPDQIIAVIRETVVLLPGNARDVRIHLHPEDAALVRERLVEPGSRRAWTLVEDPVIARGGCRVTSGNSSIDARIESRIGAAISAALGDERASAASSP